jgi:hypothetical protein
VSDLKAFSGTVEGKLIELLRQVTFKIKIMDFISRNAFAKAKAKINTSESTP